VELTFLGLPAGNEVLPPRDSSAACDTAVRELDTRAPRSVHVICDLAVPGDGWTRACRGHAFASVRAFVFDTHFSSVAMQSANGNSLGDIGELWASLPELERMFASGVLSLAAPATHDALVELQLCGDPLTRELADALGRSRFGALARCAFMPATEREVDVEPWLAALRSMHAPSLAEIVLTCSGSQLPGAARSIAAGGRAASWRRVSIRAIDPIDDVVLVAELPDIARAWQGCAGLELGLPLSKLDREARRAVTKTLPFVCELDDWGATALRPATYEAW
jgi:hypothetical protein